MGVEQCRYSTKCRSRTMEVHNEDQIKQWSVKVKVKYSVNSNDQIKQWEYTIWHGTFSVNFNRIFSVN